MMRAIPGVKAKAGAKLVSTEKITRPDRRNSWRLSMAGEPDEDRLSLDAWSLIGLIAGGASVPLLIVVLARLFGHMPS